MDGLLLCCTVRVTLMCTPVITSLWVSALSRDFDFNHTSNFLCVGLT